MPKGRVGSAFIGGIISASTSSQCYYLKSSQLLSLSQVHTRRLITGHSKRPDYLSAITKWSEAAPFENIRVWPFSLTRLASSQPDPWVIEQVVFIFQLKRCLFQPLTLLASPLPLKWAITKSLQWAEALLRSS